MDKYLKEINDEFNSKEIKDWYMDDLFYELDETNNPIKIIFQKYGKFIERNQPFNVEDEDVEILLKCFNKDNNVLVDAYLQYLIACSNKHNESHLIDSCKNFIEFYFNNINGSNGLYTYNLTKVLSWTIIKFPSSKTEISNLIFDHIIAGQEIKYLDIPIHSLGDTTLCNLFNKDQYENIFDKYVPQKCDDGSIYLFLDIFEEYLQYIEKYNKNIKNKWLKRYCDFVIENLDKIDNRTKQTLLRKIIEMMDGLGSYSNDAYLKINKSLKVANQESLKSMQKIEVSLDKKHQESLNNAISKERKIMKELNNRERLYRFLFLLTPLDVDNLKKLIKQSDNSKIFPFKNLYEDEDGNVINYKEMTAQQMFSIKSGQDIGIMTDLKFSYCVYPFFEFSNVDDELKIEIKSNFQNNSLVENERKEYIQEKYIAFFKKDFVNSVYDIILEFESSLRYYFENEGFYIYKKNKRNDLIGLSDIFNYNKNNTFRDKLLEVIDEDYYFTLTWLLTDDLGFGLRNKIAHRYKSTNLYKAQYSILAVLHIYKIYMAFNK